MIRNFLALTMMIALTIAATSLPGAASPREGNTAFIQIEAHPDLAVTRERLQALSDRLDSLNGFVLGGGWYAIALGPFEAGEARQRLRQLRRQRLIPGDSFVVFPTVFRSQFWPVADSRAAAAGEAEEASAGAALNSGAAAPAATGTSAAARTESRTAAAEVPAEREESLREARRSESRLSRDERKTLQKALKWAGYYKGRIDGAFGRGTRAAMRAWQEANGVAVTGVLTTRQRAALLDSYNAVLAGTDLQPVTDTEAGIRITLPMGLVRFDRYEYPFAHYVPRGDVPVRVLLLSQKGDARTLAGLFDILQTLRIVPTEGPRKLKRKSFTIDGANGEIVTHVEARLVKGAIKGFILVWPAGDETRRLRVLGEMQAGFEPLAGALAPRRGQETMPPTDLLAGLEVRRPVRARSGFFTDARGTVVTVAEAVEGCARLTLEGDVDADVVSLRPDLGLAILRPFEPIAPAAVARFADAPPTPQAEVAVAGFSWEGRLGAPTLTFGRLVELSGLAGEPMLRRLALPSLPGDAGGPVLDGSGSVIGMLLPRSDRPRKLPPEVSFALGAETIIEALAEAGLQAGIRPVSNRALHPRDIEQTGQAMTTLVSCWN